MLDEIQKILITNPFTNPLIAVESTPKNAARITVAAKLATNDNPKISLKFIFWSLSLFISFDHVYQIILENAKMPLV